MPVWKFHSIEQMNEYKNPVKKIISFKTNEIFDLLNVALPPLCKRGVQKFRTIEEANQARKLLEIERAKIMNRK